jgi:hypothetical protein
VQSLAHAVTPGRGNGYPLHRIDKIARASAPKATLAIIATAESTLAVPATA